MHLIETPSAILIEKDGDMLLSSDVIIAINGRPIEQHECPLDIVADAYDSGKVDLSVIRHDGETRLLRIDATH